MKKENQGDPDANTLYERETFPHTLFSCLKKSTSYFSPIVIIVLASMVLYANTLKNGFVYDDWIVIVENLQIRELDNLPKLIQKDYFYISREGSYRPLATFTYFIDYAIFGLKPWGYHLTNVFLHAMNGALLYIFLTTFFRREAISRPLQSHSIFTNRALLASLIFLVHPVLTEPVNAISYREDLLVFFFFIASLTLYIKARATLNKRFSVMLCLFSYLTYFLALLSKEMAITLPLIIYCYDWFNNKKKRSLFKGYGIGYIVLTIIYLYLRFYYFYRPLKGNIPDWKIVDRFLTIPTLFLDYLKLMIFPYSLSAEYIISPSQFVFSKQFIISFIITCTLLLAVIFLIKKKKEEVAFGILFFCVTLLPVYNIIAIPNPFAERYLYLPAVGFAIIAGSIFYDIFNAKNLKLKTQTLSYVLYVLFFTIVSVHGLVVIKRNRVWSDDYTLWSDTVNKTNSGFSHFNLARACYDKALIDEAIKHYKISIKLDPANPKAYNNLGLIYANQEFLYEAMELYKDALKLKPDMPLYHTNIANLHYKQGQLDDAIKHYLTSLELKPDILIYYQVGVLYIKQEKFNEAVKQFQKALELNPKFAEARSQMESASLKMGSKEAKGRYRNLK